MRSIARQRRIGLGTFPCVDKRSETTHGHLKAIKAKIAHGGRAAVVGEIHAIVASIIAAARHKEACATVFVATRTAGAVRSGLAAGTGERRNTVAGPVARLTAVTARNAQSSASIRAALFTVTVGICVAETDPETVLVLVASIAYPAVVLRGSQAAAALGIGPGIAKAHPRAVLIGVVAVAYTAVVNDRRAVADA
jgi:hypothetical protein